IVNGTQPVGTMVPEMVKKTGSMLKAYGLVKSAFWEVTKSYGKNVGNKVDDPIVQWAPDKAMRDRILATSMFDPDAAIQEAAQENLLRDMSKHKVLTLGQKLSRALGWYSHHSMFMFRAVEKHNNMVGFHAGFKEALARQLSA